MNLIEFLAALLICAAIGFFFGMWWWSARVANVLAVAMEKQDPAETFNYVLDRFGVKGGEGDE